MILQNEEWLSKVYVDIKIKYEIINLCSANLTKNCTILIDSSAKTAFLVVTRPRLF